jgi:hypothetical protein
MLAFLICFMPDTLSAVPEVARLIPKMLAKRRDIMRQIKYEATACDPVSISITPPQSQPVSLRGLL